MIAQKHWLGIFTAFLFVLLVGGFACCGDQVERKATFSGNLVDKRYVTERNEYIVLINDKQLDKIIKINTTPDVYYKTSVGETLNFSLDSYDLWKYGNGTDAECQKLVDSKTLKPAKEYLKTNE